MNPQKTKYMVFSFHNKPQSNIAPLYIESRPMSASDEFLFLGIQLDSLMFHSHSCMREQLCLPSILRCSPRHSITGTKCCAPVTVPNHWSYTGVRTTDSASPHTLPPELCELYFLFIDKLGLAINFVLSMNLHTGAKPVAAKARRLALTLRDNVAAELTRSLNAGIIERVSAAEWASPIVVVEDNIELFT